MSHRAVERERRSDADGADHEADLVIGRIGQHAAQVVFDDGEKDREDSHYRADPDQLVLAGEHAREGIDSELGSERREDYRAHDRCLRIGILQPVVQERERRLDAEGDEDDQRARLIEAGEGGDREAAGGVPDIGDARKQQDARKDLDAEIAHRGEVGSAGAGLQDQENRGDGGQFPEHEQREQVAGEDRRYGGPGIGERHTVLDTVVRVQSIDGVEQCGDQKGKAKQEAEAVYMVEGQRDAERFMGQQVNAVRGAGQQQDAEDRRRNGDHLANDACLDEQGQEAGGNQQPAGVQASKESGHQCSPPCGPWPPPRGLPSRPGSMSSGGPPASP